MMKLLILLSVYLVYTVLAEDTYITPEDFDSSELLQNDRLLTAYAKCLVDQGPCTPEVKQLKDKLPEALATRCAKCTEKQKQVGKTLAQELKHKHPELWEQLVAKYDPEGKHQEAFKDYLKP